MSIGKLTRYAKGGAPAPKPPRRNQILKDDTFQLCGICGWEWPASRLRASRTTGQLVCPADDDQLSVSDREQIRQKQRRWAKRFDHAKGLRFA